MQTLARPSLFRLLETIKIRMLACMKTKKLLYVLCLTRFMLRMCLNKLWVSRRLHVETKTFVDSAALDLQFHKLCEPSGNQASRKRVVERYGPFVVPLLRGSRLTNERGKQFSWTVKNYASLYVCRL